MYSAYNEVDQEPDALVVTATGLVVRAIRQSETLDVRVVRQLNEAGMAWLREQVAATGLFTKSQVRPYVKEDPGGHGASMQQIIVTTSGGTVTVGQRGATADFYTPSAAWDKFDAIVAGAGDPDTWVPAAGWTDPSWTGYHAATYCLTLEWDYQAENDALDAGNLAWPSGVMPFTSFGTASEGRQPLLRYGAISSEDAYALAASIRELAILKGLSPDPYYTVKLRDGGGLDSPWISDGNGPIPFVARLRPLATTATLCQ